MFVILVSILALLLSITPTNSLQWKHINNKEIISNRYFNTNNDFQNTKLFSESTGDSNPSDFSGKEFDEALKKMGPVWNGRKVDIDPELYKKLRKQQEDAATEELFREYPYSEMELPILPDCNNYYSGKFGDYFWHQNSDQVYVYTPLDSIDVDAINSNSNANNNENEITKKDIDVDFQVTQVSVKVKGKLILFFNCLERIIPDGSFWVIETDENNKKYILLDLEKRYRMINWKNLFGEAQEDTEDDVNKRKQMLEKLFAANKGVSKLTGKPAESVSDMLDNKKLMEILGKEVDDNPNVIKKELVDADGMEIIDGDDENYESEEEEDLSKYYKKMQFIDSELVEVDDDQKKDEK